MTTACPVRGVCGDHDYSQPPHNTPEEPRDSVLGLEMCDSQTADGCTGDADYELVLYQVGTHEWIRLAACVACTALLRARHAQLGPGGSQGVHRVRELGRTR